MFDVNRLQLNTLRYEFGDGLRDFQSALWLLIIGFLMWIGIDFQSVWLPPMRSLQDTFGNVVAALVIFGAVFGAALIFAKGSMSLINVYLRRRWLWRETGIVTAQSWTIPRSALLTSFGIILLAFLIGFWLAQQLGDGWIILRALAFGTGLASGYQYLILARRLQWTRYRLVALLGVLGTVLIIILPIKFGLMGLLVSLLWAVLLVSNGVYALRQFLIFRREMADAA